jgi:hypothetical protein
MRLSNMCITAAAFQESAEQGSRSWVPCRRPHAAVTPLSPPRTTGLSGGSCSPSSTNDSATRSCKEGTATKQFQYCSLVLLSPKSTIGFTDRNRYLACILQRKFQPPTASQDSLPKFANLPAPCSSYHAKQLKQVLQLKRCSISSLPHLPAPVLQLVAAQQRAQRQPLQPHAARPAQVPLCA